MDNYTTSLLIAVIFFLIGARRYSDYKKRAQDLSLSRNTSDSEILSKEKLSVILIKAGNHQYELISEIVKIYKTNLNDAKYLAESAPVTLSENIKPSEALYMKHYI